MNAKRSPGKEDKNGSDWNRPRWMEVAPGVFKAASINKRTGNAIPSELQAELEREPVVNKGKKRVTLPRFPRTEWGRVSIRFVDDRAVLLSDGKETKPCDFEGLGCMDNRTEKPDSAWGFLRALAMGGGLTSPIPEKEVREHVKKHKQKVTDILRMIFQNDTDPFETDKGGVYRAKFSVEYPKSESGDAANKKYADIDDVYGEMTAPRDEE
ncbi:hypothetical protein COU18_03280 [Candidatus Kaiserbacteria bacterium CG10_big_fil_rev_8_21_14_0_10_51_14]|uniref:Uncharacterized protein n=1 Tax=Candidatus Kaiserbacteria bacterium CG10_big_fil_rev_8_21_14_0_10_51_14 TaxID=1974610 RepID=A0A2H0UDC2_9BACT|nr:MAG: hypothetical protein COU18_03280 [Candidatus Kaiserbacteria bacterium CG10_big_fil_rev_8_21_14_0_10_51_14]